jgi:hypothetical protein
MNLEEAAANHVQWKLQLEEMLSGANREGLDPEVICDDTKCALGKWIQNESKHSVLIYAA